MKPITVVAATFISIITMYLFYSLYELQTLASRLDGKFTSILAKEKSSEDTMTLKTEGAVPTSTEPIGDGSAQDLQAQVEALKNRVSSLERSITVMSDSNILKEIAPTSSENLVTGYNIIDILSAGCRGKLSYSKESFRGDRESGDIKPELISGEEVVSTSFNKMTNSIAFDGVTKYDRGRQNLIRMQQSDMTINVHQIRELPFVAIGKEYNVEYDRSGGTVEKGTVKFSYKVLLNESKQMVVNFETSTNTIYNHRPVGVKTNFKLVCVGASIDEMDGKAPTVKQVDINEAIKKKVFEGK